MTMVIVTHEMGFARDVADTVCFLDAADLRTGRPQTHVQIPESERTKRFLQRIMRRGGCR